MILIREEQPGDAAEIRTVNERAFGQPAEANLVDKLREDCEALLSLVTVREGRVVGHILFSPITFDRSKNMNGGMGLAPMAVLPDCQRQGIGSRLVERGLALLRSRSCPVVVVLGHPEYYPRFGFVPASAHGIRCQWDGVPDEAFMIHIFDAPAMEGVQGIVRYRAEFEEAV